MTRFRVTLAMVAFCGVAAASSFSPTLDRALCIGISTLIALSALGSLIYWCVGEWSLHRECVRSRPRMPHQTPRYWPTRESSNG